MKIGVLTSSRADYSIYLPLLKAIREDTFFDLTVICFGMHLSKKHGYTIDNIKKDKFRIVKPTVNLIKGDTPKEIAITMGSTVKDFASLWNTQKFDLVFALGDRYEMFSAVSSTVPFNIPVAHIHGGETTLGAIDNCFRHAITLMSKIHFPVTERYKKRVIELTGSKKNVYNVGTLSYDNLSSVSLLTISEFKKRFNIDLSVPTILITFHPETVSFQRNEKYISELISALDQTKGYQFVITMPNADTSGNMIRKKLEKFIQSNKQSIGVESFGTIGYLSCMKHCSFLLGNTSSGFAEAAYFPKYVINLGDRQEGRLITDNIYNCKVEKKEILKAIKAFNKIKLPDSINIYGKGNTAKKVVNILKDIYGKF